MRGNYYERPSDIAEVLIKCLWLHGEKYKHLFLSIYISFSLVHQLLGTAVAQWLRCCATNRKVAGSIPDGVIGIFH